MVRRRRPGRVRRPGPDSGGGPSRSPGSGSRTCPRAAARSPSSPSTRTCGSARTRRRDARRSRPTSTRWYEIVPAAGRAPRPAGRQPERRRAADARDRPGADVPAAAAAARRAVARAGAARHPRSCSGRSAELTREQGIAMLHRRAERRPRARARRRAATCSRPAGSSLSGRADEIAGRRRRPPRRTWGSDVALLPPARHRRHRRRARSTRPLALALVLIFRSTGIVNFAQGEMAMFSTFVAWGSGRRGLAACWLAILRALALSFVGGVVIERVIIRPVERRQPLVAGDRHARPVPRRQLARAGWIWGFDNRDFPRLFPATWLPDRQRLASTSRSGIVAVLLVVVGAALPAASTRTKLGLAMRAAVA